MEENTPTNPDNLNNKIYELYLNFKKYIISSGTNIEKAPTEIKSSSEPILIINELQNYLNSIKKNNNNISILENMILKLEKDLKYHIKNEFMFKIQKDTLDNKIKNYSEMEEEFEALKEKVRYEGGKFLNNDRKDNEIKILRRENSNIKKEVKKMEIKIKNLEKKEIESQGLIDELKLKISKNDKIIEDMEKELENLKNKKNLYTDEKIEGNNFYLQIPDKNSLAKISKVSMKSKRDLTNYQWPLSQMNNDTAKSNNQNRQIKTIDNNIPNKYIINTFSKVNNNSNKNIIAPIRNLKIKDEFKHKNSSVSMRSDENKKFDIIGKYLPNKYRNLSKINSNKNKYGLFNLPSSNSNVNIRHNKKEDRNYHEYSGFNNLPKEF